METATRVGGLIDADQLREGLEQLGISDRSEAKVLKLIRELEPHLLMSGLVESSEGPEQGHRFRFTVNSAGASAILDRDAGDTEPHDYADADWWGQMRTIEVRAWSLEDAIRRLGEVPFALWFEDPQ